MTALLKKLNFKGQAAILVLGSPGSFAKELDAMSEFTTVCLNQEQVSQIDFALVFVTKRQEIGEAIEKIFPKLRADAVLWFCYPKGTSKKYKCDFNRDTGWEKLRECNLDAVRQVAIDEDWSALRFRESKYIKH